MVLKKEEAEREGGRTGRRVKDEQAASRQVGEDKSVGVTEGSGMVQ